jgi:hypothetical protein
MTDKDYCSGVFAKAAQELDQGVTQEEVRQHIGPDIAAAFELGILYFAMRMVRSTREHPSDN